MQSNMHLSSDIVLLCQITSIQNNVTLAEHLTSLRKHPDMVLSATK